MGLGNYAFDNVIALFGAVPLEAFAEGDDVIRVTRRVPMFDLVVGASGEGVASRMSDLSGEITIKLLQTSPSNAYLGAILQAQEHGFFQSFPFLLKDSGTQVQLVGAAACIIQSPAEQIYGASQNDREWVFLAEQIEMI